MIYDTLVVGAGLAGLTTALRLTEHGQKVVIVAKGVGATHLAPATVDVLGYLGEERVDSPASALTTLLTNVPGHPYGRVSREQLSASLEWFCRGLERLGYAGGLDHNRLFPTAIGVARPSALAPRTMLGGDLRDGGRFLFVGLRGFKDFHPSLLADNLAHARLPVPVTARALELEPPAERRGDLSGRLLARRFDSGELTAWLVRALQGRVEAEERVGLPPVLGLRRADETLADLENRLERRVFEVPTLPPSIPGMRLYDTLTAALRKAGARLVINAAVVGAQAHDGQIESVQVASAATTMSYRTHSVVLASGGFASGGLTLDSRGAARETVFDLPVAGVPEEGATRFVAGYFDAQPLSRAGVAVDDLLRPTDRDGSPVYRNLHAAGAILAGAVPWKEKSGTGISVATGYAAADAILAPSAMGVSGSIG
jgi:glycerol-3-phosphate dehydrogenase subunit B